MRATSERRGYESLEDDDGELDRVAITGKLSRAWFAAVMIVNGEGRAHFMPECRYFRTRRMAERAFADAH